MGHAVGDPEGSGRPWRPRDYFFAIFFVDVLRAIFGAGVLTVLVVVFVFFVFVFFFVGMRAS